MSLFMRSYLSLKEKSSYIYEKDYNSTLISMTAKLVKNGADVLLFYQTQSTLPAVPTLYQPKVLIIVVDCTLLLVQTLANTQQSGIFFISASLSVTTMSYPNLVYRCLVTPCSSDTCNTSPFRYHTHSTVPFLGFPN